MDDSLNKNIMGMIKLAPLFFLFNGYWMVSNRQIFENAWAFKDRKYDGMESGHHIYGFEVNWATPIHIVAFGSALIFFMQTFFNDQLRQWGFAMSDKDINVDEDLPNFFTSLRLSNADEIVLEN